MLKAKCDACVLNDKDHSIKEVNYCDCCKANLCAYCESHLDKRIMAMVRAKGMNPMEYIKTLKDCLKSR